MKLFLIKCGKALQTIKRDGVWRGGKRVFTSFFALFRRVGSGNVLFITGGVGDSALYRAHHVAEELTLQGFLTSITVQDNPLLAGYAKKFSVFIFHRVLYTPNVAQLIANIKAQGKEIIFETDDLVYDPEFLKYMDYYTNMNGFEKKLYEHGVGGEILHDEYVKVCTTTTAYLADKLRAEGKRVIRVPNRLSQEDVAHAQEILTHKSQDGRDEMLDATTTDATNALPIRIGYFSGTLSHNKDFATVTPALIEVMRKYPEVRLLLVGPLETESVLQEFSDRIETLPYAPRKQHFANIAKADINIAPLEIGNPFCESKSELKFFEAGIMKVPTVATATAPYKEAIENGVDGFVAATHDEWVRAFERLIESDSLRRHMGEAAHEKTMREYANGTAENAEYYDYIRSKLKTN